MGSKRTTWLVGMAMAAILLLLACDTLAAPPLRVRGPGRGFGPPAHAPAYGHRNKVIYGYTLIFDADCGLYIVVGLTDCYYYGGRFYRWHGGAWEISLRADKWEPAGHDKLPAPVQVKAKSLAKPTHPDNGNAKPGGNTGANAKPDSAGSGNAKSNTDGPSKPKPDAAGNDAKPNPNGSSPAKSDATASKGKSDTNTGGSATAADKKRVKSNATASGNSPTKAGGTTSSQGKKPRSSAKGKR